MRRLQGLHGEGGRRTSALSTGQVAPPRQGAPRSDPLVFGPRPGVGRKREVLLRLLRGEADPADGQPAAAVQRIGELSTTVELLHARIEHRGPLRRGRSR